MSVEQDFGAPSAWTNPPTDYDPTYTVRDAERKLDRIEQALAGAVPVFRKLPDGTLVVAVRRPIPLTERPGISDGLRRTLIAMALTTIIAISLGAIAWVRFAS